METIKEIQNVEGIKGRYTREFYTFKMFKPVKTPYNLYTRNLENYILRRINKAKDITKVFKKLEKEGYTITTVETYFGVHECYNTEIAGIFNGNIRNINILWSNKEVDYYSRGTGLENNPYKQTIFATIK